MMRSTVSILGLYNYDPTIFVSFMPPQSIAHQREAIIDEICLECAELEILYPDPDMMRLAIKRWTELEGPVWAELQATREYDYNPIWNKDGTVTETETRDLQNSKTGAGSNNNSQNTSDTQSTTAGQTDTKSVEGFNEAGWSNAEKNVMSGNSSQTNTGTASGTGSYTESESGTDTGTISRERRETGNIGVTTTQTMIKEQREVVDFSVERYIVQSFKRRFCILVY